MSEFIYTPFSRKEFTPFLLDAWMSLWPARSPVTLHGAWSRDLGS